ncbi:MAG: Rieske (2Fe-2S) protein [Acidimicrobiia bacterium]
MSIVVVAPASDVPEGEIKRFDVAGREIAVTRSDGVYYAFDPECTHEACDLVDDGEVDGTELTCLCHFSVFDLATGEVIEGPADLPLQTFELTSDGFLDVTI